MTLQHIDILFQLIAFLFAISVHESAHAWMANRRGDPTARMLGRISLIPSSISIRSARFCCPRWHCSLTFR